MNKHTLTISFYVALATTGLAAFGTTPPAYAAAMDCLRCHDEVVIEAPAHRETSCTDCHSNVTERKHRDALAALGEQDICAQCHRLSVRSVGRSVHGGNASCSSCHGHAHEIWGPDNLNSPMSLVGQIATCGECHDKPPELVQSFIDSSHGRGLLRAGLVSAPSCADCHGSHRILAAGDDKAMTSHARSPEMCGECHAGVLREWTEQSIHGIGWKAGRTDVPVCTQCHSSHAVQTPSFVTGLYFSDQCGDCHEARYNSFRGGFHGKFTNLGLERSANCVDCHSVHKILPQDHPDSSIHPDNLQEMCGRCHQNVTASFVQFDPHNDPSDPDDNRYVYYIHIAMLALLFGVFGFFGVHDFLWLQRAFVGTLKGEFKGLRKKHDGPWVRRFSGLYIGVHIVVVVTFLTLALTGLPLKFDTAPWAQKLVNAIGGIDAARVLHRIAAIGTFGYMGFHLLHLFFRMVFRRERGMLWGPGSMVPQWQDLKDMGANLRYFLYLGPRPEGDRWSYWEKFDYLAVFWGVMVIGLSGLMLWAPTFFATYLPGWTINAAYVIHSEEALLATGFIFIFHFFHTHLRPESFPMDPVVFTGRMPLEKFKEERAREYERMVADGTLEQALCEPPSREKTVWVYILGFTFLSIGLALAVGIFVGLLTH